MDVRQGRTLIAFYAIDVFIDAHKAELPKTSSSGVRERFSRSLAELGLNLQEQEGAPLIAQQLTKRKASRRAALIREFMLPIARIARLEGERIPELVPLKMPRTTLGVENLLAHAAGMLTIVSEHVDVFVELGLRPTVVEDMQRAIDGVIETLTDRSVQVGRRSGATKGIERLLSSLHRQTAILDSFVRNDLRGSPSLLANWRLIKRVERLPGRRRKARVAVQIAADEGLGGVSLPIRNPNRLLAAPVPWAQATNDGGMGGVISAAGEQLNA